ncbi:hypothetical protein TSUD_308380 [Trifolium subterraneum]|nr:hypothetical protein TSUD_308380 [Trifolium subterraneum]
MASSESTTQMKVVHGDAGYILEDVPHLSDYVPNLPTYPNPLRSNPAYSVVKQYFVHMEDTVPQKVVVHKDGPRGVHFRRAGPRQKVYFRSDDVVACIVTCGGLCPGLNTVIREIVCGLSYMYGVDKVLGIDGGYRGFYSKNTIDLTPKVVNDIHKRGGTILGTSRGGHDTGKIVDSIQDRGINQVYIIGGDGTQRGAAVIYEFKLYDSFDEQLGAHDRAKHSEHILVIIQEVRRRGLKVSIAGIPKTIDNDIPVIDRSFGFDTAVEEAQRAINAAHVEAESVENGIGVVKLMGRYSGFIAMYATLASRDVDCCLIPESPFHLEGKGGLFEFIKKRLKENGHMVIVIAEGAGQDLLTESMQDEDQKDASGNKLLQDVGLWISHKIKTGIHRLKIVDQNSTCARAEKTCLHYLQYFGIEIFDIYVPGWYTFIETTSVLFVTAASGGQTSFFVIYSFFIPADHFAKENKMAIVLKYIDPTYMIRAIPSNASDSVYCTLLAQSAVHGAMAGYTGFTAGLVNGRHTYIPFNRITERMNKVVITDRMWARLLSSTNQPSFLKPKDVHEVKKAEQPPAQLLEGGNCNGGAEEVKEEAKKVGIPTLKMR